MSAQRGTGTTHPWLTTVLCLHRDELRAFSADLHDRLAHLLAAPQGATLDEVAPLVVARTHVDAAIAELEQALHHQATGERRQATEDEPA
jgi:hypothetical protein